MTLQALSLVEKAEPIQVRFTLRLRDQRSKYVYARWNVKSTWIPTRASNGSRFMVTWTIFLEVGLLTHQNRETMTLRTLTNIDLFYFYHVGRPT